MAPLLSQEKNIGEELGLDNTSEPVGTAGQTCGFYKNLLYEDFLLHQALNPIYSWGTSRYN